MSKLTIDIDGVHQANQELLSTLEDIQAARKTIASMNNSLPNKVLARRGIDCQISDILSNLDTLQSRIMQITSTTTAAVTRYQDEEDKLYLEGTKAFGFAAKSANAALFHEIRRAPAKTNASASNAKINIPNNVILKVGSKGKDVKELQKYLNSIGGYKLVADGIFGPNTKKAVIDYQRNHNLKADGIVGLETIKVMKGIAKPNAEKPNEVKPDGDKPDGEKPKEVEQVVKVESFKGATKQPNGYYAPPSITDWSKVESKLDPKAYSGVADPAKYLRFAEEFQCYIDPVFAGRLAAYARDHKIILYMTGKGGLRDIEDQIYLYKKYGGWQDENGEWHSDSKLAAKPGTSWHELGMASDIDKTKPDMMDLWDKDKDLATDKQKDFIEYGIYKPLTKGNGVDVDSREAWHFQPLEAKRGILGDDRKKLFANTYEW